MERVVGAVAALRRFPLRSAAGESPASLRVLATGLEHDRSWQLVDGDGAPVTARRAPGLAGLAAAVGPGGELLVDGVPVDPARPPAWAQRLAGPGARLEPQPDPHRAGAAVHLVSLGAALDPRAPQGCDPGERANAVLDLAGALPGDERSWTGRSLALGADAVLVLTRPPRRCLGVYADVLVPGEVRVGDAVVLLDHRSRDR